MFDKAFSKFATLGRNTRPGKDRKRRASLGGWYAADDTNNDRELTGNYNSNSLQWSPGIDLNAEAILQLNKGLMRRSQSTESLNISLHQKWRTIDIDIDSTSPSSPDNRSEENPYQDLNVLSSCRGDVNVEFEVGYESDSDLRETDNIVIDENLYEDTSDYVRDITSTQELPGSVENTQSNVNSTESTNVDNNDVALESYDNTPIDESDSDNEYHDTVVKGLNVIEISEQGIVSKLRNPEDNLSIGMDSYFESRGMVRIDNCEDEEEEEDEEQIELDGIKSNRTIDELQQEAVKTADSDEDVLELNEVLSRFEIIEEDTRKDIDMHVIPKEIKTKPKLLPKPKPPLKPKPQLKPVKSLGTTSSSVSSPKKKVSAIVTSFECESLSMPNVQLQGITPKSKSNEASTCDNRSNSKPNHEESASKVVKSKDITSKLTAIFSKDTAMKPTIASPKIPPPAPPCGGRNTSRFDSECESLHSGTDLSYSSEQSSGTGSIGSPSLPAQSPTLPPHCVSNKPWSDQSSITSIDGPSCSVSSSEDFPNEEPIGEEGDVVILPVTAANGPIKTSKKERKERQVSQRWQRNHLKKVSAQLQTGGAVKRRLQKIQSADNLKRFTNYLANKRSSLELLSEPIQRYA